MAQYRATDIEIISGPDPACKRPGMHTDTASSGHLALEVVGKSIDEALPGDANTLAAALRYRQPLAVPGSGAVELVVAGDNARTAS